MENKGTAFCLASTAKEQCARPFPPQRTSSCRMTKFGGESVSVRAIERSWIRICRLSLSSICK